MSRQFFEDAVFLSRGKSFPRFLYYITPRLLWRNIDIHKFASCGINAFLLLFSLKGVLHRRRDFSRAIESSFWEEHKLELFLQ